MGTGASWELGKHLGQPQSSGQMGYCWERGLEAELWCSILLGAQGLATVPDLSCPHLGEVRCPSAGPWRACRVPGLT